MHMCWVGALNTSWTVNSCGLQSKQPVCSYFEGSLDAIAELAISTLLDQVAVIVDHGTCDT